MTNFDFFDLLSKESQDMLEIQGMKVKMKEGMELFTQGDECKDILFLTSGSVRVFRRHDTGNEITLYYLEPFEQCNVNLNSAFSKTPAIGTAISESDIEGYLFKSDLIKELYIKEPPYQQYIFSMFSKRLESMATLIEDLRFETLDDRLLDWLRKTIDENYSNVVVITHEKLSSHLGTSREVISRLLKIFEKQGILKLSRGKIELL